MKETPLLLTGGPDTGGQQIDTYIRHPLSVDPYVCAWR